MTIKKCSYCKIKKEIVFDVGIYSFCSSDCRFSMTKSILIKQKKKINQEAVKKVKAFNSETRRLKESIKSRTGKRGFYDNLKVQLHKYIKHVLRKGEPCYTCGLQQRFEDSPQSFHVGHFIPQKRVDPRRFMLINLRIQCQSCNTHNSGMRSEYRQRLIE